MKEKKRKLWQFPWQYKESMVWVTGLLLVGFVLQLSAGKFNFFILQFPVNLFVGIVVVLLLLLFARKKESPLFQWFSGVPLAVMLIGTLVLLGVIMGLTPQFASANRMDPNPAVRLGLHQMTSSWPFVLVYAMTLLSLGALIIRRLSAFNKQDYAFYLNHIGLWILLFSAGMGAADMHRFVMHVREGEVEWRVYNESGEMLELPIAIRLNDFDMEVYPPKLAVIDRETGIPQPESRPDYFQIDTLRPEGVLGGWKVTVLDYLHNAVRNSDSAYQEVYMPGASPAVRIKMENETNKEEKTGWVCAGNQAQLYMTLLLDSSYCVVMTQPEPKRFYSDIDVFMDDGEEAHTVLEVNKPLRIGNWMVYQYGYDNQAGRMSTYSSFELVYDPWLYPVYAGIILLALGSICLLWSGNKKRKRDYDVE